MADLTPAQEAERVAVMLDGGCPRASSPTFLKRLEQEADRARLDGRDAVAAALDAIAAENGR